MKRSIVLADDGVSIIILDQRALPWHKKLVQLSSVEQVVTAICHMWVRGAPLIGLVAAYGLCFALRHDASNESLQQAYNTLLNTRPTAVNLRVCLDAMVQHLRDLPPAQRLPAAYAKAAALCDEDEQLCKNIGLHGQQVISDLWQRHQRTINILTHCNAGRLATTDYGTAIAAIYMAHEAHIPLHVWVDETRPRLQGALTAYELAERGIAHTIITDNAGGLLMQKGQVDMCIVGADRVTQNGDVCNKIGTYLKALAAHDNGVPFYVAFPYTTFDTTLVSGAHIEIENRDNNEILTVTGQDSAGALTTVRVFDSEHAFNPSFDVTPARLITGYITENGCSALVDDVLCKLTL